MVDSDINEPEDPRNYEAKDIYEEFLFDALNMDRRDIDEVGFHLNYGELEKMLRDFHSLIKSREVKRGVQ